MCLFFRDSFWGFLWGFFTWQKEDKMTVVKIKNAGGDAMKEIIKPKNWYAFRWSCDLHGYRNSNMCQPEQCHYCNRGKTKTFGDPLSCKIQVCPVLKGKIPMNERQKDAFDNKY